VTKHFNEGGQAMNAKVNKTVAEYFGLTVEVICEMKHCALIRFGDREFVVDASDLVFGCQLSRAA
jgi:hypothetical protein